MNERIDKLTKKIATLQNILNNFIINLPWFSSKQANKQANNQPYNYISKYTPSQNM